MPNTPKTERRTQEKNDSKKNVRTEKEKQQIDAKGAEELKKAATEQAHQNAKAFEKLVEEGRVLLERMQDEKIHFEEEMVELSKTVNKKITILKMSLEGEFVDLGQRVKELESSQSTHEDSIEHLKNEWSVVESNLKTTDNVVKVLTQIEEKLKNQNTNPKLFKRVFLSIPGWMLISAIGALVSAVALGIAAVVVASKKDEEVINNIIIQKEDLEDQEPQTEQEKKIRDEKIKALNEQIKAKQGAIINQNDEEVWPNFSQCIIDEKEPPFEQIQALQTLQYLAQPSTVIWNNEAKDKFDLAKSLIHYYNENEEMIWPNIYEYGYRNLNYNGEKIPRKDLAEIFQLATALYIIQIKEEASEETKAEALASV